MKNDYVFQVVKAGDLLMELNEFYRSCGRQTHLNPSDTIVVGRLNSDIVSVVRLCMEEGVFVLRTMQVRNDLQNKGIGRLTLDHFQKILNERNIDTVYCMPFAHLEYFYGLIGFKKLNIGRAPVFLKNRINEFHKNHPDEHAILMIR